jgi:hypothetical protein
MTGGRRPPRLRLLALLLLLWPWLGACASPSGELRGLAELPPLDCAALVTGGAFLTTAASGDGTFAAAAADGAGAAAADGAPQEPIPIAAVLEVLQGGGVFQRVAVDPDPEHRRRVRRQLQAGGGSPELLRFLQQARDDGFDVLLVVEQLEDGPIDFQGTNSRWPVTFAAWILLGFGALIPDHTFESRATLRFSVRELPTGRVLHDQLLTAGPIELALLERASVLGILSSILVPPFWVADDREVAGSAVRDVTVRRLLVSLARELKSESVRQRLREQSVASVMLVETARGPLVTVDSLESLAVVRLRRDGPLEPAAAAAFEQALLGSMTRTGDRHRYEALLPPLSGPAHVQVLVGTIRGGVASATFAPGGGP